MINRREFMKRTGVVIGATLVPGMLLKKKIEIDKGGPGEKDIIFGRDGDQITAVFDDFIDPMQSPIGYGDTREDAKECLFYPVEPYNESEVIPKNNKITVRYSESMAKDLKKFHGVDIRTEATKMVEEDDTTMKVCFQYDHFEKTG